MRIVAPVTSAQTGIPQTVTLSSAITHRQAWNDILAPFLLTRLALLVAGWLARLFPPSPDYPLADVLARGWHFSPYRLLDIWGRWDTGWYLSIVRDGYMLQSNYTQQQSNMPFYPLYPMIVRMLLWPIPDSWQSDGVVLLVGIVVANLFLVGALLLIYLFAQEVSQDISVAQRTVLYILLFPTSFFLSAFYTESTFLFFSAAALYAAQRRKWAWAALAAALLGITRPVGILMTPLLGWIYLSAAGRRVKNVRANILWLLLAPLPFLLYLAWMGQATGDWLAPVNAQQAYFRAFAWPWETLLSPIHPNLWLTPLEQFFVSLFLVVGIVACWRLPTAAYGLWVLALMMPGLFTGIMTSSLRFLVVAVPAFVVLAQWGKHPLIDRLCQTIFFAIQIVLMVAWSQFYFIA